MVRRRGPVHRSSGRERPPLPDCPSDGAAMTAPAATAVAAVAAVAVAAVVAGCR